MQTSPALVEWLGVQPWRGNVRQLKAATRRAVLNASMKRRSFLLPGDFELPDAAALPVQEDRALMVDPLLRLV